MICRLFLFLITCVHGLAIIGLVIALGIITAGSGRETAPPSCRFVTALSATAYAGAGFILIMLVSTVMVCCGYALNIKTVRNNVPKMESC